RHGERARRADVHPEAQRDPRLDRRVSLAAMRSLFCLWLFWLSPLVLATAHADRTKLTWYGHAAFRIDTPSGKTLLIDPWIQNPANPTGKDDVGKVPADLILVTHGHFDHVGDSADIAKRTKAKLVATFDLGNAIVGSMAYPKDQFGSDTGGNFGGTISVLGGEVAITFVPAVHS